MPARILVPLDSSTASLRGLDEAIRLAVRDGCALRLVHVVDTARCVGRRKPAGADLIPWMEQAGTQVLQLGRARAEAAGIAAQTLLFTAGADRIADLVVEQAGAWKAGIIVIGTNGRRRGLGNAVRAATTIPVRLVVHAARPMKESGSVPAQDDAAAVA